jgi:glycosyltransferase involved in cell wall biosynthesis
MIPRIVLDCERMKHSNTGLYHYCLHLGRQLQKHLNEPHEKLTFYSPLTAVNKFRRDSEFIMQNSLQKFYMPSTSGFDIWHSTFQLSRYIPQRNRKIKVVLTIHDLNFVHEKMPESRKSKLLKRLQRNINRADALVCISEFSKNDMLEHCDTGNKPIHLIYNGTNTLKSPGLYGHSYKPERPFLFSLGVLCRKKNFHVLLPLLQQNHDMELLIAGRVEEPEYLKFIHQAAKRMRVEENVRVLGDISEPEKSWYYQNCYAFALPSIAEGFGLPVAEAMSAGKPVFLSNRTALPEIGSTAAFYFRDFNALHMQQVFADGMERYETENMQQLIRDRGASFCWDKAAKEYIDVYRSLL